MSQNTNIEWTDATWNPTRGCSRISPGCVNCYAERIAARFSTHSNQDGDIPGGTFAGYAIQTDSGPRWTGKVELIESKLLEPLHWKKPRRVFVNSMSDLFHENLPDESIDRVFAVMEVTRHITYQVLTKRAGRMREYMTDHWRRAGSLLKEQGKRPLDNVWLGVSVENPPTADERIPELLRTPASLRFVSYEPALAEVDWRAFLAPQGWVGDRPFLGSCICHGDGLMGMQCSQHCPKLDWGIIGGESGPGARPFRTEWLRSTIWQFKAAGVPLFVKQLGSKPICTGGGKDWPLVLKSSKGGDWDEWLPELRVREFPTVRT